jgi:hypothetical protein
MAKKAKASFVGTWVSFDQPLTSHVQYTVKRNKQEYRVAAVDTYDSEKGEVYDVRWNKNDGTLEFACYWASSGRFIKCKFLQTEEDRIDLTFTYTDHEILIPRKT